jgi:TolB-like protein
MIRVLTVLVLLISAATAQITLAVGDFKNQSPEYYLDSWAQSVPEFLKNELSRSADIRVLERRQLQAVLEEQALSMTGLVDSSTAQQVGDLLGAQFIITGTINRVGGNIRIDANIVRVSTGEVRSEKVQAGDPRYQGEMCELLGQNIVFLLTGTGNRITAVEVDTYPTNYYAAATLGFGIATAIVARAYEKKLDEYHAVTELAEFDNAWEAANNLNKTKIVLATLTGVAAIGTIYCWIRNRNPETIIAALENRAVAPVVAMSRQEGMRFGVRINF